MFQDNNFFAFHDLNPEASFLWASPSITTCVGYEPEEVVGMCPFSWIHPDDIEACKETHQENVLNEIIGTQMSFRMRRKDGSYTPCVVFGCFCYQYIVSCYTFVELTDQAKQNFTVHGVHSAAMASLVGSKYEEFERISRHHRAFKSGAWNTVTLDQELRACLLLNRFTRHMSIMYASPSCELIFNMDPNDLLGKPILCFIRADDLGGFVEQGDLAKASSAVRHIRFWFQSPYCPQEVPCEAMLYGAADALVIILRRCLPFRRRQFITCPSSAGSSYSSISSYNTRYTNYSPDSSYGRQQKLYNIGSYSSKSPSMMSTSPSDSISSSYGSNLSASPHKSSTDGTRAYRAPLRSIPVGSIDSIRNLDREQQYRPLASLRHVENEEEKTSKTIHLLREVHTQDSELEESQIEEGVKRMNLRDHRSMSREPEEEEVEEDSFWDDRNERGYNENMGMMEENEEVQMPSTMRRHWREE